MDTVETGFTLVSRGATPVRLDLYLTWEFENTSRTEIQKWIRTGRVSVNDKRAVKSSDIVSMGDSVRVTVPPIRSLEVKPRQISFGTVHVDPDLLIIDKPAGLTVHRGAGHENDTLANGLVHTFPKISKVGDPMRPGIVHRLDRDTSGLLVVALSTEAYPVLVEAARLHLMERCYTALVWGNISADSGVVDAAIGRDPENPMRQTVSKGGRESRTKFRVTKRFQSTTLLEIMPETGRMHQIRVHLASIGHSLVGDLVYGREGFGLQRQFLHSSRVALDHPIHGGRIEAKSHLPPDLEATLANVHLISDESP